MFKSKLYLFCICLWLACANSFAIGPIKIHPHQWDLKKVTNLKEIDNNWPNITYYGDNFTGAWDFIHYLTYPMMNRKPGEDVVVAVIDTGYTPVSNFGSALVHDDNGQIGYQFLSDCRVAGSCPASTPEGSAKIKPKPGALDLGNYVSQEDIKTSNGFFTKKVDSNWHGTAMISAIISQGYTGDLNSTIAGGAYGVRVLPVRATGKFRDLLDAEALSDFFNALRWAAGLDVPGASKNLNPAQVINISIGYPLPCSPVLQDMIDEIVDSTNHPIIVVGAGNRTKDVSTGFPEGCKNVILVSAKAPNNKLWTGSNFGNNITITASGGEDLLDCPDGICSLLALIWSSPQRFDSKGNGVLHQSIGTSLATVHVSAAIANIISVLKSRGETYDYKRIVGILQQSADKFAPGGNCHAKGCVPNRILNVGNAIASIGGVSLCRGLDIKEEFLSLVNCPK